MRRWTAIRLLTKIVYPLRAYTSSRIAVLGARSAPRDAGQPAEGRCRGSQGAEPLGWLNPVAVVGLGALGVLALWSPPATAQTKTYGGRLSPVPITVAMQEAVAGHGSVTAVLADNRLTIEGTFEGLRSPATVARLHVAPRAIRGPAVADIMVPGATRGSFKAVVQLTEPQRQALEKSSLYIQIHSEKAPDGNLWGWLLPQEVKR